MTNAKAGRGWLGSEKPPQLAAGEKAIGDGSPPVCDAVRGIARRRRKKRMRCWRGTSTATLALGLSVVLGWP